MILNNAPVNEAIVSNVAEIGEFRIRNSAKAFNILSSGLYANKIRAIIRELSCNAVDSHAAAGKHDTPFDVHLPSQLEPWFAIRDYGTGLTHAQVTNIYTTYFESTKTNSNEFIGALGLGSKSPFSYTDNFTVTAIKDGIKGIYSAFINGDGVPSIALMMTEETAEPAGVEVKFSVNEYYDYSKFSEEARQVYTHFKLRPVVSGREFAFRDVDYLDRDIIPGVHSMQSSRSCVAVMGNIAYPVQIPQVSDLDNVSQLLNCGLEMHFSIGELDFQASREGLSYIPETIAAIKAKLEAVNEVLTTKLATDADAITNLWDRALFLHKKQEQPLWHAAVIKYVTDTKLSTMTVDRNYVRLAKFKIKLDVLAARYNIKIRASTRSKHSRTISNTKPVMEYSDNKNANGHYDTWYTWHFNVDSSCHFVINNLKNGAGERVKHHYRETPLDVYSRTIYLMEPADKSKPMKTELFFRVIKNPPKDRIVQASALLEKPRAGTMAKNVSILKLEKRGGNYRYSSRDEDMVWRDAGKADTFDANTTFYYVPLSGFQMQSSKGYTSGKELYEDVKSLPNLYSGNIYGVRKSDIEEIKKRKNWINFEDYIAGLLTGKDVSKILLSLVRSSLDNLDFLSYNVRDILLLIDQKSPFAEVASEFKGVDKFTGSRYNVERLFRNFAPGANISPEALINKYKTKADEINQRYPLLKVLSSYRTEAAHIAEYISLIDAKKGV